VRNPLVDPIGLALYVEPTWGPRNKELEFKLILQKNFLDDRLIWATNFVTALENNKRGSSVEKATEVDFLTGLSYRFMNNWSAGLEARNHREFTGYGYGVANHSAWFLGPNIHYATKSWWMAHYASVHKKMATIGNEHSLIIDPGSRTFDWLVARGMRQVQKQSHSFNRGMSDVLRLIAAEITKDIGSPYRDLDAIDLALRTGKQPVIFQKSYDITRFMPMAEAVAQQAVSAMKQYIESPHSLQNIILVGGGAFLFKKAVKAAFPNHKIHEVKEPMFANVRGFQLAGQNYARTVMAAPRADQGVTPSGSRP